MRTALRWLAYVVCWTAVLILAVWLGVILVGVAIVLGWI